VLAIAAIAGNNMLLLFLGIFMSIPLIIWGSTFIVQLLQRYPLLIYIGAAVLAYTAGEMLVSDQRLKERLYHAHQSYQWVIPLSRVAAVLAGGWMYQMWNRKKAS